MGIHWLVWLVIGGAVAVFSYSLGDKFTLFFYCGLLFLAIGVAKLGIRIIAGKDKELMKEAEQPHPTYGQHLQQGFTHAHQHAQGHLQSRAQHNAAYGAQGAQQAHAAQAQHPLQQPQFYVCPRCRHPLVRGARFCHNCGLPFR